MNALLGMLFLALILAPATWATGAHCDRGELGWHFYCDAPVQSQPDPNAVTPPPQPNTDTIEPSPEDRIEALQATERTLRYRAVLEPTEENLLAFMRFRNEQLERAAYFSDVHRRLIWQHPELDYTLERPTGQLAKAAWSDARTVAQQDTLATLNERYGLLFFFRGDCGPCHTFSPILREFSDRHGLEVLAVSLDGGVLPHWPNAVVDTGQARTLGVAGKPTPALVLVDKALGRTVPVSHGVLSQDALAERIYVLTQLEVGDDY